MRYWLVKGKPSVNDLDDMLRPGATAPWRTGKPPKRWAPGDRVFFWSSAPRLELVGLGELLGPTGRFTDKGETIYRVKYLTGPMANRVSAATLRADPTCGAANFLKPAVAQGVLEVPPNQAHEMYRLLNQANGNSIRCWKDIPGSGTPAVDTDDSTGGDEPLRIGQGFGLAANNLEVERAAIEFVSRDYARRGWTVRSVEGEKCGYDLECTRAGARERVEVKGIRSDACSFILTSGELSAAKRFAEFVLIAVTDVLGSPTVHRFSPLQLQTEFRLDPITFRAVRINQA